MDSAYSRPARPVLGRSPRRVWRFGLKGAIPALLLLLSLGIHGLLLKLPMPPQAEVDPPLPPEPEEPALSVVTLPSPAPLPSPVNPAPANLSTDSPQPSAASPAEPLAPNLASTAAPQPSAPPEQNAPTPETPAPGNGGTLPEIPPPVVEFPHPENFRAVDCGGNYDCRAVSIPSGLQFLTWVDQFQERLRGRGYTVRSLEDEYDKAGNRVYELTAPNGETQYALFRSNDLTEASYVVVDSRAELNELYRTEWL